ncbi:MAG TPA: LLM class flavin-dependent oxidoreductase [Actinomycetota bacterium]|nr:LLM class flavin-dependent oxidoreductase [Actinomycetota bacterium]
MERTGFAVGYDPAMDGRDMAHWMREAEERGYEIGFFSETIELMRDSVSSLSAMALATERLTIGCTQIVRLRSPLVMAQTVASLDELSGGRLMLAPGSCTGTHAKRHGLEPADPGVALREWIESMRLILAGGNASYDGEVVKFKDVELGFEPPRRQVPMFVPATSRKGLRIAGAIGDGVLLNAVCSPEYSANALKIVRESVEESGRDWERFEVAQLINCSVADDEATALDAIRWEVASKLDPIQLPFIAGPKMRVGEPYFHPDDFPKFEEAWREGGKRALIEAVPDSYIRGMTASGTPEQVKEKVQRYRDVGVRLPILRPAAKDQAERLLDLFAVA